MFAKAEINTCISQAHIYFLLHYQPLRCFSLKIICPGLFETRDTQIQKLVCYCQFFKIIRAAKTEMAGSVGIGLKLVIWWSLRFISDYLIKKAKTF